MITVAGEAMRRVILSLFLLISNLSGSALAQTAPGADPKATHAAPDPQVARLEAILNQVNLEQQAVYQQFQMTQELRRNEIQMMQIPSTMAQAPYAMGGLKDNPPPSYDDNVRLLRERQERIQQYTQDLNRLYAHYAELGEQKKLVLDQLLELARTPAN
jgi:hypothetical protein